MFKKVAQSIANQMDPGGNLVPVHSILDHEHFQPLCLVRRKRKTIFHPSPGYKQTWYRLDDVLLPGGDNKSTESLLTSKGGENSTQFTVKKLISDRVDGNLRLQANSTSLELKGAASLSREWSIKLQKNNISVPQLEALTVERKMNLNHSYIQQLQRTRQNLYVVHETVETLEETSYEESIEAEGSFVGQLYAKFCAKGTRESKQSITIPKGCTLAFRAIQLAITEEPWDLDYFPKARLAKLVSDGVPYRKFQALQKEIEKNCQVFSQLSSGLSHVFLEAFKAVMRDRNLFQELTQQMDAVLEGPGDSELKTESPDLKGLFSSLQHSAPEHLYTLAGATIYALDALDELMEDQLLLLLESLDEKIVPQQIILVGSILENMEHMEGHFSVEAPLLSFSREKEQELTVVMVEMSGVTLEKDGSAVCRKEAFTPLAALYVSLYVLDLLNNSV